MNAFGKDSSGRQPRPKVLAVAYGGGHASILIPAIEELRRRGIDVVFLALTIAAPQAKARGIPFKRYLDYRHLMDLPRILPIGTELAKTMHNPDSGIDYEESVHYLGVNMAEAIERYGAERTQQLWAQVGRHVFLPVSFLKKIIQEESPDVVLTTNSPKSEKASIIAATELGIPSIRVEDLFIETNLVENLSAILGDETYQKTIGTPRFSPSRVAVMCEFAKEIFATKGPILGMDVAPQNVRVTGQPILETIDALMETPPAYDLFPNRSHLPTIVWAQEGGTHDEKAVREILTQWQLKSDQYNFIVKVHPNMTPAEVSEISSLFDHSRENFKIIHKGTDPNLILWNSSLLIAQESTMLTQAVYMGRPVVVLDPQNRRPDSAYVRMGVGQFARSVEELNMLVAELVRPDSSGSRKLAEGRKIANFEKHGTRHIADLCVELLESR